MARRNGIYSWENEPAEDRRSEFRTTVASDWQQSANSTFAEPSRMERERRRRKRRGIGRPLMLVVIAVVMTLLALSAVLTRLMSK